MRNIQKKEWVIWGSVIVTILLNIVIIKAVNNNQVYIWFLTISTSSLVMVVYRAWQEKQPFLSFIKRFKSLPRQRQQKLLSHSVYPSSIKRDDLQVIIGNNQCSKPYNIPLISIEPWENTHHNTYNPELNSKEFETAGGIKPNLPGTLDSSVGPIWQIDSSYHGYRTDNGNFDSPAFERIASMPDVKMIQINLESPFSPEYGVDSTLKMGKALGAKGKPDLFIRSGYTTFHNAEGLVHFIETLRNRSNGKPVGIRLSINDKKDFRKFCHAIRKTQIIPDFISITGTSGKVEFNHSGLIFPPELPLYEALLFVSQTLIAYELNEDIKVLAVGKDISAFDILKMLALGANSVCVDSNCFNVPESVDRLEVKSPYWTSNIQYRLMKELVKIMNVGGFRSIKDVTLSKFLRRLDVLQLERYTHTEEQVSLKGFAPLLSAFAPCSFIF